MMTTKNKKKKVEVREEKKSEIQQDIQQRKKPTSIPESFENSRKSKSNNNRKKQVDNSKAEKTRAKNKNAWSKVAKNMLNDAKKIGVNAKLNNVTLGDGKCFYSSVIDQCSRPEIRKKLKPEMMKVLNNLGNNEAKVALLKENIINYIKSNANDIQTIKNYKGWVEEGIVVENGICANLRSLTKIYNKSYSVHNKVIRSYECNEYDYVASARNKLKRQIMSVHAWDMLLRYLSEKDAWANELIILCTAAVIGCDIWIASPTNNRIKPFTNFTPSYNDNLSEDTNYYSSIWMCARNNFHFQLISPVMKCDVMSGGTKIGHKEARRISKKIRHQKINLIHP